MSKLTETGVDQYEVMQAVALSQTTAPARQKFDKTTLIIAVAKWLSTFDCIVNPMKHVEQLWNTPGQLSARARKVREYLAEANLSDKCIVGHSNEDGVFILLSADYRDEMRALQAAQLATENGEENENTDVGVEVEAK